VSSRAGLGGVMGAEIGHDTAEDGGGPLGPFSSPKGFRHDRTCKGGWEIEGLLISNNAGAHPPQ
jgi:hypothetical protein